MFLTFVAQVVLEIDLQAQAIDDEPDSDGNNACIAGACFPLWVERSRLFAQGRHYIDELLSNRLLTFNGTLC